MMTAVIYLEQTPGETVKRVAGKHASRPFHIPMDEGGYTQEELTDAIDTLDQSGKIIFGGNFTASSWPDIRARVRYLAVSKGVKIVYLDHLTALIDTNNVRPSVETNVKEKSAESRDENKSDST